jgi:hypothetical protein
LEVLEEGRQFGETYVSTSEQVGDGGPVSPVYPNSYWVYQLQTKKVYWIGKVAFLLVQGIYTWIKVHYGKSTAPGTASLFIGAFKTNLTNNWLDIANFSGCLEISS